MNRRGEVLTIVLITIAATFLITALVPSVNPMRSLSGGGAAKQEASWTKTSEKPIILESKSVPGQAVVAYERTYDTGQEVKTPKLTWQERVGNFISGLSMWSAIFILVSLVFFGGAPIVWIVRKYFDLRSAFKNTVAGIREADDETFNRLKPHLAAKQDKRDKKIVDKMKSELH